MPFLLLVAGLILLLAGSSWFTGATTVGVILLIAFGFLALVQVAAGAAIATAAAGARKRK